MKALSKNWIVSLKDEKDHKLKKKFMDWFTQQTTDFDGYFVFDKNYHGMKDGQATTTDISYGFEIITLDEWKEEVFDKELQLIEQELAKPLN